jgi:hypothetical protein
MSTLTLNGTEARSWVLLFPVNSKKVELAKTSPLWMVSPMGFHVAGSTASSNNNVSWFVVKFKTNDTRVLGFESIVKATSPNAAVACRGVVMATKSFAASARSKKVFVATVTYEVPTLSSKPAVFLMCVTSVGFNLMLMTREESPSSITMAPPVRA